MTKLAISSAALALFFVSIAAAAQQPGHHMPMPSAATQQPASGMCGAEDPAKPGMSMGCGGCSMMRGMMSAAPTGMMGGGMMGMMGSPGDTPRMMEMRAEMMRAMADIMTKYAKQMQQQGGTR